MGASSGWNLVARRPQRARVAPKTSARHLVSVPRDEPAGVKREHGHGEHRDEPPASRRA